MRDIHYIKRQIASLKWDLQQITNTKIRELKLAQLDELNQELQMFESVSGGEIQHGS